MATYLVHRCHYDNPSEKSIKKFDDETVLDWFRNRWQKYSDPFEGLTQEIGKIYGLSSIFENAGEHGLPAPETDAQLSAYVDQHLYSEGEKSYRAHYLEVSTDDDELQECYFLFDNEFLQADSNAKDLAFLMHTNWELPTKATKPTNNEAFEPANKFLRAGPTGSGTGAVYFGLSECVDSSNLDPVKPFVFKGVRLAEFPYLMFEKYADESWPLELRLLRSQMFYRMQELPDDERYLVEEIHKQPSNADSWSVYGDWLLENGRPPLHMTILNRAFQGVRQLETGCYDAQLARAKWPKPEEEVKKILSVDSPKTKIAISEHLAQACLFYATFNYSTRSPDIYHQWWLFDDLWAAENEDLAQGLIKFCVDWRF